MRRDLGPKSPSVLIVAKRLDIGGTERHIVRILPALRQSGIDASLFVFARGGELERDLEAQGIRVYGPSSATTGRRNLFRAAWTLVRHMRAHRPDIAHFFLPEPYLVGSLAAILARIKTRIMSRRSLAHYQTRYPMLARLEWRLHRGASALIANSSVVQAELARETDDGAKVGLIYNGVEMPPPLDDKARLAERTRLGIAPDTFLLLNVANLIAYKGHDDLLEALARAQPKLRPNWRLVIAGRDVGIGAGLMRRADALGVSDHVTWAGELRDTHPVYAAADAFVLASHEEGFSNSLIEAMAYGLPVMATAVGGNLDAVEHGTTGLLVPVKAPAAMAQAIVELAASATTRASMGQAGRQRVERLFSLEACVRGYVNLYRGAPSFGSVPVQSLIDTPARQ